MVYVILSLLLTAVVVVSVAVATTWFFMPIMLSIDRKVARIPSPTLSLYVWATTMKSTLTRSDTSPSV